jgi:hypothetical protein
MKLGITSTLSIAGVLAAGAAAFALNSAVLSDSGATATSNMVAGAVTTPDPAAGTQSGSVSAAGDPVAMTSTKVSDTSTTYGVGTAGSVIIDTSSGSVVVTDVVPAAGWTAEPARTDPDGLVKVHFTKGATRLEFSATMQKGLVKVNTISESAPPALGGGTGTKPTIPSSIGGDDDDDHDDDHHGDHEDEDEDHDDEDHEDEDDD